MPGRLDGDLTQHVEWMRGLSAFGASARMMGFVFVLTLAIIAAVALIMSALGRGQWTDWIPAILLIGVVLGGVLLSALPVRVGIGQGELHLRRWGRTRVIPAGHIARVDLILNPPLQRFGQGHRVYEPLLWLAGGRRIQLGPFGNGVIHALLRVLPAERFFIVVYTIGPCQRGQVLATVPLAKDPEWETA